MHVSWPGNDFRREVQFTHHDMQLLTTANIQYVCVMSSVALKGREIIPMMSY